MSKVLELLAKSLNNKQWHCIAFLMKESYPRRIFDKLRLLKKLFNVALL